MVALMEIIMEFIKPLTGLKLLPNKMFKLLIKYLEGNKDMELCCISYVPRVAFINIIQNGNMLRIARKMQNIYFNILPV
jgi:hypothetical protein